MQAGCSSRHGRDLYLFGRRTIIANRIELLDWVAKILRNDILRCYLRLYSLCFSKYSECSCGIGEDSRLEGLYGVIIEGLCSTHHPQ